MITSNLTIFGRQYGGAVATDFLTNLVAYYPLNNNANDAVGGHNGTATSISFAEGKVGNAAGFNTSSYVGSMIDFADTNDFSFTNGGGVDTPMTILLWVKVITFDSPYGNWLLSKRDATSGGDEWQVWIAKDRSFTFWRFGNPNTIYQAFLSDVNVILPNVWYQIAITADASKAYGSIKGYLNGVLMSSVNSYETGTYTGMVNGSSIMRMGNASWNVTASVAHRGYMDEVYVYKGRQLTDAEVLESYNLGNAGNSLI